MQHFRNMSELIADLEAEAARYNKVAVQNADDGFKALAAQSRSYATAHRNIANMLRDTVIGPTLKTAKPFEECR